MSTDQPTERRRFGIVRVFSSFALYPIFWVLRWDSRRLKGELAKLEEQD